MIDGVQPSDCEVILALEPLPCGVLDEAACEEAYLAIADMIDMRVPHTFGHSRAVAEIADLASRAAEAKQLRRWRSAITNSSTGRATIATH